MSWNLGGKTITKVTKYTVSPAECAFCGEQLEEDCDPYKIDFSNGTSIVLCDNCGSNFIRIFGLTVSR